MIIIILSLAVWWALTVAYATAESRKPFPHSPDEHSPDYSPAEEREIKIKTALFPDSQSAIRNPQSAIKP